MMPLARDESVSRNPAVQTTGSWGPGGIGGR